MFIMKNFLTILFFTLLLQKAATAQCPPGAFAYQSLYPQCPSGCGVLLLGWPEGVLVNIYGGTPLTIVSSALISGTLYGGGTGDAFTCVPCNIPLVFASTINGAVGGCVIATIGIVPVKLTDFSVDVATSNKKTISWSTSQEIGPVKYAVEKSNDGINFKELASIAGLQQISNKYTYLDNLPVVGNSYYRIKAVEVSGSITYSKIIFVKNENGFAISTYPNPVQTNFKVSIPLQHLPATIEILDAQGQRIHSSLTNLLTTDINYQLKKGIYIIKVTNNKNITVTQRLIKN